MKQDIMMILDASIRVPELAGLLKGCGYLTLPTDSGIKIWESGGGGNDEVEVECGTADLYRYDESELDAIKEIVSNPQLVYISFRNRSLAERIVNSIEKNFVSVIDDDHGSLTFKGEKLIR